MSCTGWGLQPWGGGACQTGPWGSIDVHPPQILNVSPTCGDVDVNPATPITITVSDLGCSELSLECVKIWVNTALVYSGEGLTIGVNQNNGFQDPCDEDCSSFTVSVDPVCGGSIWIIQLCCTNFTCEATVGVSAIFCDNSGNIIKLGSGDATASPCTFKTIACSYIDSVEIIDHKRFVLRFKNPLIGNQRLNPDLYKISSYTVTPVSGSFFDGDGTFVKNILVEKSTFPRTVILETTRTLAGSMYEFTAKSTILDIFKQPLIDKGKSCLVSRHTKVDKMVASLPQMYVKSMDTISTNKDNTVSLWHLLAATGIEDEKSGGNY